MMMLVGEPTWWLPHDGSGGDCENVVGVVQEEILQSTVVASSTSCRKRDPVQWVAGKLET